MKLHRFIGDFDFSQSLVVSNDQDLINQIKNVLHLAVGEQIILSTGDTREVLASIENLHKNTISFKVLESKKNENESDNFVTLYCSILKRENFELVSQKATECGIKSLVPVISDRTVKTGLKVERLEKIIKEAGEQSGRGVLPILGKTVSLTEAFLLARENEVNLFFDASGKKLAGKSLGKKIGIFVGPEGGWTDKELCLAKENGCQIVSLGSLILRGETAAIVASYLAVNS